MTETQSSEKDISPRLQRIAELARKAPDKAFESLNQHIDMDLLREAVRRTRKDGAPGIDGVSAAEYVSRLDDNLRALLDQAKSGTYRAPPVRRVHIPKGDGQETRPIGVPTFEDKVLQRAVAMILEAIYEQDFLDCSHGFRPKRGAHDAIRVLDRIAHRGKVSWILEADIMSFFDSLDRT